MILDKLDGGKTWREQRLNELFEHKLAAKLTKQQSFSKYIPRTIILNSTVHITRSFGGFRFICCRQFLGKRACRQMKFIFKFSVFVTQLRSLEFHHVTEVIIGEFIELQTPTGG